MSNKGAKTKLIKLYGKECFIDKLHLRPIEDEPVRYKSKGQIKRMRQLTYHHIREKSKGGKATVENGALLSAANHEWFHKQPKHIQRQLNEIFQEYKRQVDYNRFMEMAKSRQEQLTQREEKDFERDD